MQEVNHNFSGSHYLVTGASSGIGREIAIAIAEAGGHVHALARRADKLQELAEAFPGRVEAQAVDVCEHDVVKQGMQAYVQTHGPYNGIVYAAGLPASSLPLRSMDIAYEQQILEVNYFAAANVLIQAMQPQICAPGCSVVFISSISAYEGSRGIATYAASKAGLLMLAKRASSEIEPETLRFNTVSPGLILHTGMSGDLSDLQDSTRENLAKKYPLRMGQINDIVQPVIFLLSDESVGWNGQDIVVDGGDLAIDHD